MSKQMTDTSLSIATMAVGVTQDLGRVSVRLLDVPFDWLATDTSRMAMWFDYYHSGPFSRQAPDLLQLVWADEDGHFPDEALFDPDLAHLQPLLHEDSLSYPAPRVPHRNPARHRRHQR